MKRAPLLPLLIATAMAVGPFSTAMAAPDGSSEPSEADLATAREHFRAGLALEDEGDWAAARRKFQQVAATKVTAQVTFHLALCDEHLGALVAARRGYEDALRDAAATGDSARAVAETATSHLEALRPKVPRLRVSFVGLEDGDAISVDGQAATREELREGLEVDPGQRKVTVRRGGRRVGEKVVRLGEGERASVRVEVEPAPDDLPPPPPAPTRPPPEPEAGGSRVPALVVGGIGVASLVGAGVTFGLSRAAVDDVRATCSDPDGATGCDPGAQAREDDARTLTTTSVVLGVVGAACVATGVVLWVTSDADPAPASSGRAARARGLRLGVAPAGLGGVAVGEF